MTEFPSPRKNSGKTSMLNWKPEYIALLNRFYWMYILKEVSDSAYLRANVEIGRAAHVRPLTVERWIEGTAKPNAVQGERLLRWAARVTWWEIDEDKVNTTFPWRQVSLATKLSELIRACPKRDGRQDSKKGG